MAKGIIKKLVSQQEIDCPPFIPLIYSYAARLMQAPVRRILTNPGLLAKSISTAQELFHSDALVFPVDDTLEAEAAGAAVRYVPDGPPLIAQPMVSTLELPQEPVEALLQKGRLPLVFETLKRLKAELGREVDLLAGVTGPLTVAFQLGGEGLRENCLSDPQKAMAFFEFAGQFITRIIRTYGELGVTGILLGESCFSKAGVEMGSSLKSIYTPIMNTCSYYEVPVIFYPDSIPAASLDIVSDLPWKGIIINRADLKRPLLKEWSAQGRFIGLPLTSEQLLNPSDSTLPDAVEDLIDIGSGSSFFITTAGDISHHIPAENIHLARKCLAL